MSTSPAPTSVDRGRATWIALIVAALVLAAAVGAYVDWIWWLFYQGILLTIAAGAVLLVGAILSLVGRGIVRRIGLLGLAVGIGLLAGQNLGPSREPLIVTQGGTMTIRIESPEVADATGPADCTNVASETEFQVSGNPILHLRQQDRDVDGVYLNVGDRWEAIRDEPRKGGVRLSISVTDRKIPDAGAPLLVAMGATDASTLESRFNNQGGSIRFAGLAPEASEGFTGGEPIDLAGTIEWTCGEVVEP